MQSPINSKHIHHPKFHQTHPHPDCKSSEMANTQTNKHKIIPEQNFKRNPPIHKLHFHFQHQRVKEFLMYDLRWVLVFSDSNRTTEPFLEHKAFQRIFEHSVRSICMGIFQEELKTRLKLPLLILFSRGEVLFVTGNGNCEKLGLLVRFFGVVLGYQVGMIHMFGGCEEQRHQLVLNLFRVSRNVMQIKVSLVMLCMV